MRAHRGLLFKGELCTSASFSFMEYMFKRDGEQFLNMVIVELIEDVTAFFSTLDQALIS